MKIIRQAEKEDMMEIMQIYAYYVKNSVATFAYDVMCVKELMEQWESTHNTYPYLVCEVDGNITGYMYAHRYKEKEAYQWNVELSIYVHPTCTKQHIGTQLMEVMISILRMQHLQTVYSCITIPNEGSIALHRRFGFTCIGEFHQAGYKFDRWLDVVWMEKKLQKEHEKPVPWIPVTYCKQEIELLLTDYNKRMKQIET